MKLLTEISEKQKITIMVAVMLAMLLSALDQTIVGTAMPRIVRELNGLEHLSWVFTAYMLASTVTVPIYGKLSDIYDRKKFFLGGIVIFLVGSALSGLSQNMMQLILFRALQGIGGGAMMANAFTIIADLFPPAQRGKWQGIMGAVFGLSAVVGPTLGGWLTDNASWRWNFYINLPIGFISLLAIWFLLPTIKSHIKGERSIDYFGASSLILGLVPLLLGIVWGGTEYPWISWPIIGCFVAAFVFLCAFVFIEGKAKEPIMPLSLFKNKIFVASVILTFLTGIGMFGIIIYIPLFAQGVVGVSATNSGVILLPVVIGLVVASLISGQIISKTGKYKALAIVGTILTAIGMFILAAMTKSTTETDLFVRMIVVGLGIGITMPIFNIAVQNAFPREQIGVSTASVQLFRSVGGTVGAAIMGGVLNNALAEKIKNTDFSSNAFAQLISKEQSSFSFDKLDANSIQGFLTQEAQNGIQEKLHQLPAPLQPTIFQSFGDFMSQLKDILAGSITEVFFIGAVIICLAVIVSFFLKEIPLRGVKKSAAEEAGIEIALEEGNFPASSEPEL